MLFSAPLAGVVVLAVVDRLVPTSVWRATTWAASTRSKLSLTRGVGGKKRDFEEIFEGELASAVRECRELIMQISDVVTGFKKNTPKVDFTQPLEDPPSPIIRCAEVAAQILSYTEDNQIGKYILLMAAVCCGDGTILYGKRASSRYEMQVVWRQDSLTVLR